MSSGVRAIILVEHDMHLVASYSQRIIALAEGKVLADLPPGPFFSDPMVIIETVVGKRRAASISGNYHDQSAIVIWSGCAAT
jgi:energy-coupling factor transporter ATP-binding protein EcfA2